MLMDLEEFAAIMEALPLIRYAEREDWRRNDLTHRAISILEDRGGTLGVAIAAVREHAEAQET